MIRHIAFIIFLLYAVCFIFIAPSYSQREINIEELKKGAPKIFVDCRRCDRDFMREEIPFVNFVRDRKDADVHILVTTQRTGGGGTEYTMAFIGQKDHTDIKDTLKYVSNQTDTEDEIRRGMVRVLKMGLVPYVAKTPIADCISILFEGEVEPTAVEDKWNLWVFSVRLNSFLYGEKASNYISLSGSLSANRITPESKLRMSLSASYNENNFDIDGETITSTSDRKSFSGLYVKSISEHWSIGTWITASSSTFSNIDVALSPSPAVEYNLFPYSESTRRQLRFLYRFGYNFRRYREETIYDKISENLLNESLSATLELKERWGTISTSVEGSHYLHDLSKYRIEIFTDLSLRIFKGLSLNLFGSFSAIHDQLSLPKGEATVDEVLLRRRELETSFDYFASIGFSYTFGSVYSNVVNPRFGR